MERAGKVRETAREIIDEGQRPTAKALSEQLSWPLQDVHRCLNYLEREGEVETYRRKVMGVEHRLVGVNRS
jgi:predicted ArsR family transcriptional regulator